MDDYIDDTTSSGRVGDVGIPALTRAPVIFTLTSPSSILTSNLTVTSGNYTYNSSFYDNYTSFGGTDIESDFDVGGGANSTLELPKELSEMSESSKHCVIAYCILFVIATSGNLSVLLSVYKQYRKSKSRISLLILHLSIADLIVCCTLIPTEVFWRLTIQWRGGNILCKVMQFLRAFGLYLSSMVLICVSFDRFFAILFPMKMLKRQGHQRIKIMLWIAWIASAAFSAPQALLFSIASHPDFPSFKQCVTNEFLKNTEDVRLYSIFSVSAMYFAPLVVILFTYTAILIKIIRKAHQNHDPVQTEDQHQQLHQRSRPSIRFRMSIRNSGGQRSIEQPNSHHNNSNSNPITATCNIHHHHHHNQPPQQQQNHHSKLLTTARNSQGRKKGHNSTSSANQDQGDSSEEGSYTGSTCSTMNVTTSNSTTCFSGLAVNNSGTGGRLPHHPPPHQSPSPSPDVVTLGRVNSQRTHLVLRRSQNAQSNMSKAKNRTLIMTIVIVIFFCLCWTPYVVMTLWYMFDWASASEVDPRVQDGLFVMAVANSCVNPLIYGSFAKNCCGLSTIFGRLRRLRGQ